MARSRRPANKGKKCKRFKRTVSGVKRCASFGVRSHAPKKRGRRCRFGVVKSGPRKGLCKKRR